MHCDCAICELSSLYFLTFFWQMGNNKLHLFLARLEQRGALGTWMYPMYQVYSQGVCNINDYDFIYLRGGRTSRRYATPAQGTQPETGGSQI